MAIKTTILIGFSACLNLFTVSCAVSTDYSEGGNPMPDGWALETPGHLNQCTGIDAFYQTLGLGRLNEKGPMVQTRLDVAFGHAFPSSSMPENVYVSVNEGTDILTYRLGHPVNRKFSLPARCHDGWFKSEVKLNNTYIGEGGTLDYSIRKIEIGKSPDGNLIVHLLLESQSSSFLVLKARDTSEIWSKYEKIKSENQ